ncbi:MAG: hypothetical protein ACM3TR_04555 [Caulobacteraceae bacterium]
MNKSSKKMLDGKHKSRVFDEYNELVDMIESGMEDYEIAAELGVSANYVTEVKKDFYNDYV